MLGDFYYANNQLDKATEEYAALYRDHPKDLLVKKNYIQLLLLRDRIDDARKLNDELMKARPDDEEARVYKGEIELRGGKANDAVNTLQAVVKSDPDNAVAHYQLGLAYNQAGNANRAEPEWRDAVRLNPDFTEAHRALAAVAAARGDASSLAQEAEQIIRIQPGVEDGYRLRGMANVIRKQYQTADKDLHLALEKQPNNPPAYVWLGNLHAAQQQLGEAQKSYQLALDQDPNSTDALGGVLNVYQAQKQTDRALATAKAQMAKYPKNAGFHVMVGALLVQAKDLAGAEAEFKQATDLDKNNVEARVKLGMIQSQRGNADLALQTFVEGQKINPRQGAFYLMAGDIYNGKSDWDHAKQQYQKVLEVQPEDTSEYAIASNDLAYVILEQGGNADLAFQMAQKARQKLPDLPNTADTLGWAFYHKQVYSSAITLCKEAVKKSPDNAMYNYHLGLAYAKNGQAALARQQRDRVKKIDPKFPNLDKLDQALSEMKG
jgi:tetratricopeptide (TPR) repeat protein